MVDLWIEKSYNIRKEEANTMTIKEMNDRRKELGYSYERVAELSGVPVGTVQKVLGGITKSPRYETLSALERVLRPMQEDMYDWEHDSSVREAVATYGVKKQGAYTIEDYYALSKDERLELIDGVLYNMSSPSSIHQVLTGMIYNKIANYIMEKKGQCIPIVSPMDVQLDCDNKTIVQPDVMIVCDRDKIQKGVVYGAPDFVVEVLSPSTRRRDKSLKVSKYMCAGVREYWIVDPKKKTIVAYIDDGEDDCDIFLYTFEHEVPVHIFNNECKINFKEIYDYIAFMYEK